MAGEENKIIDGNAREPLKPLAGQMLTGQNHLGQSQLELRSAVFGELVELFDSACAIIVVCDTRERIVFWNRGAELKYQWRREEAIGRSWRELLQTQFPCAYSRIEEALVSGGRWEGEIQQKRRDGCGLTVAASLALRRDELQVPVAMLIIGNDISEGSRMAAALGRSEANYRGLVENDIVGVFRAMMGGELVYANKAVARMFGFETVDEFCSVPLSQRFADCLARERLNELLTRDGRVDNFEFEGLTKSGAACSCLMSASRNGDEISGMLLDMTERKVIEKQLWDSEKRYREFVEFSPDGIMVEVDGAISFVNPAAAGMLGGRREQLIGRNVSEVVGRADWEEIAGKRRESSAAEALARQRELRFRRLDGTRIDVELSATPVLISNVPGIQVVFRDVTLRRRLEAEREQAEASLRQNWERIRGILENMPIMMSAVDVNGLFVVWNRECERVTGYSAADIVNNPRAFELLYPNQEQRVTFLDKWNRRNGNFRDWEFAAIRKDGRQRMISWSNISGEFPVQGWRIWALGVDITERKLAEEKLFMAQRQLMDMIEFLPDAAYVINQEKKVVAWNQEMEVLTGVSKADIIGKGDYAYSIPFYGKPQPALVDMLGLDPQEVGLKFGDVKVENGVLRVERFIPGALGGKGAFLLFKATALYDRSGEIAGGIETVRNITEHKESEAILKKDKESFERLLKEKTRQLLKVQAELADARHLSEIGTLAATVAHELRNPLAAIRMGAFNIGKKSASPELKAHIETIEKKIRESDQIINNLLNYSKIKTPLCEYVRLGELIDETISAAKARFDGWEVELALDNKFPSKMVFVDPLQFKEMVTNILMNAYESLAQKKGRIAVRVKCSGNAFAVSVADNGVGISAENLKRISRPFFTTKSKGTGLGLAVCSQMAAMHGGKIRFASREGKGTTVTLTLPVKRERAA